MQNDRYTTLNPDELLAAIREIKQNHPNAGEVIVQGHLEAKGIHVQREQIRNAIHHIDPTVSERKRPPITDVFTLFPALTTCGILMATTR